MEGQVAGTPEVPELWEVTTNIPSFGCTLAICELEIREGGLIRYHTEGSVLYEVAPDSGPGFALVGHWVSESQAEFSEIEIEPGLLIPVARAQPFFFVLTGDEPLQFHVVCMTSQVNSMDCGIFGRLSEKAQKTLGGELAAARWQCRTDRIGLPSGIAGDTGD